MSRKVILFKNERLLIEQVKGFPVIYDKTHKDYRKAVITEQCWTEIAEATGEEAINCKKRWKSLRDTFIKYYRLELMDDDAATSNRKKKKWVYYNELSFLKPHVELFGLNDNIEVKKVDESSSEQPTVYEIEYRIENEEENSLVEVQSFTSENKQDSTEPITTEFMIDSQPQSSPNKKKMIEIYRKESSEKNVESSGSAGNKSRQQINETTIEESQSTSNANSTLCLDADEKFLLSCAPALKRLTPRQNAYVRFNIQKLLYDVEFGSSDDESAGNSKRKKMKH